MATASQSGRYRLRTTRVLSLNPNPGLSGMLGRGRSPDVSLSDRARRKGATAAQPLLPPGSVVREYVVGRAHARMATGAVVAGAIFATAFLVMALASLAACFLPAWRATRTDPVRALRD